MRERVARVLATVSALAIGLLGAAPATAGPAQVGSVGEVRQVAGATAVPGSYLVVLKESRVDTAALAGRYGGEVTATWRHALHGFAAKLDPGQVARLAADPAVAYVQQDTVVRLAYNQVNPPSWGLDRIDQRDLPLNAVYSHGTRASNVNAYVIDTGIRTTHTTFGGRAFWGVNTVDGINTDCHGHGTHVAGTIGGTEYGVAKLARLYAVKVLDCGGGGTAATVISGVDWVTANAVRPAVANMSLGGGADPTIDAAVTNSINAGISYVVASGNWADNACAFSPARTPDAITVNATDNTDTRAWFSNFGSCTDVFAPGVNITSAWAGSDTAWATISGTSMAAPHVAGIVAMYLAAHYTASPATVTAAVLAAATSGRVTDPVGSPNLLAHLPIYTAHQPNRFTYANHYVNQLFTAEGGRTPYTWSATGLPVGLDIDSWSGRVTGAPSEWGPHDVVITVTDADGRFAAASFRWTIRTCDPRC